MLILNRRLDNDDISGWLNEIAVSNMSTNAKEDLSDLLGAISTILDDGNVIAISGQNGVKET